MTKKKPAPRMEREEEAREKEQRDREVKEHIERNRQFRAKFDKKEEQRAARERKAQSTRNYQSKVTYEEKNKGKMQYESEKYKHNHPGRGKYERVVCHYQYDIYDTRGKHLSGGHAFGYKGLAQERSRERSRYKGGYRIKIHNETRGYWLKK